MLSLAKSMLSHVPVYVTLQRIVGADRLRYRCLDQLVLKPGDRVLDVGCGPAYYFDRLPQVDYYGFDTSQIYIDHARRRYGGDRAHFHCEIFSEQHLDQLPQMDAVMLLGLLHHLSDEQSSELLRLAARILAPGGQVISVDTCFVPTQGRISRWMSENDRGEFVRVPAAFEALAREFFGEVDGAVLSDVTRIPGSFWMMRMGAPVNPSGDVDHYNPVHVVD